MPAANRPQAGDLDEWLSLVRDGLTNAQIAEHFGCTVRTLDRRRRANPTLTRAIIAARAEIAVNNIAEHGTPARYRNGCKCVPCTRANTVRGYEGSLRRRERKGLPPPNPHLGRPRGSTLASRQAQPDQVDQQVLIEQGIARGEGTSSIMQRLSCDYATVKAVRDRMGTGLPIASTSSPPRESTCVQPLVEMRTLTTEWTTMTGLTDEQNERGFILLAVAR